MAKFTIDGELFEFDDTELLVDEMRIIKKHAGMGVNQFGQGLQDGDPDAVVGMLFLMKRRAGTPVRWQDFDKFNLTSIQPILEDEAGDGEVAAADDPPTDAVVAGPTPALPAGTTRKRASPAT